MNTDINNMPKDLFELTPVNGTMNEKIERPSLTFWQDAWARLKTNKGAMFGLIVMSIIIIFAIIGPKMNEYTYKQQIQPIKNYTKLHPRVQGLEKIGIANGIEKSGKNKYVEKGIEKEYFWFGTDELGRDLWTRVWSGTRVSLYIGLLAALVDLLIGVIYGAISGFYGGKVDIYMMRIIEIIGGIPSLVVVTLFILILEPGLLSMSLAIGLTGWMGMSRVVRSQILKLKNQEFVLASRTLGASNFQLIWKHLIPNILGQVIIMTTFTIPGAIFYEAFLAFIGLGLPAPNASLGVLINDGYKFIKAGHGYMMLIPSIVICLLMLGLNLFANGLRDALDPKMRNL